MTSGPVEAAPEGGAVSEVGRTGEGREPNNDTTPTRGFEYAAQQLQPDGSWRVVGIGPTTNRDGALCDYIEWQRDVPDGTFRIVRRPIAEWEPTP